MSLFFMALRFWCKMKHHKAIGWDDCILIIGWMFLAIYVSLAIAATRYGLGRHLDSVPSDDVAVAGLLLFVAEFFAILAVAVSKSSFAVTLLRFALERWHKVLLWGVIASVNLVMWSCAVLLLAQCRPTRKLWNVVIDGSCWPRSVYTAYSVFAGTWSAAMDFILAIFPWVLIWPMRIRTAEKIGVGIAMSLGVFAGITGVIKTTFLPAAGAPESDFTYISTDLIIWAAAESAVVISAASIPFMRPLLVSLCPRVANRSVGLYGRLHRSRRSDSGAASENRRWPARGVDGRNHGCILEDTATRSSGMTNSMPGGSGIIALD
ncbi:hypothetical protein C7999DRAFT_16216 [Corynascus novoguineensis]|uniref:Rhodopsin domain-containing protein n=1 Tax=Corynascus novoguineensis TaxID=1126955 RepID=A0AAN7CNZ1_9PEZI|nr:hypothetical protein C7999DRAFT_16216 [Corynascus novoguineensis]